MKSLALEWRAVITACLFLTMLAIWQTAAPVRPAIPRLHASTTPAQQPDDTATSLTVPPREAFAEIDQRPLFVPTRRPPPPPAAAVAPPAPKVLDKYTVIGIVAAPDRAVAIVRGPTGSPVHLRAGQTLEGWTLETIAPNKLTFASGDQHQDLELKSNKRR